MGVSGIHEQPLSAKDTALCSQFIYFLRISFAESNERQINMYLINNG
jgi:hypothetical protein